MTSLGFPPSDRSTPCDLCGRTAFQLVEGRDRHKHGLATVVCCTCGLVAHEKMPTDAELADYYADHYRQDYHGEILPSAHRVLRAWSGGKWLYNLLQPYVEPGSRVFEIGAGIGCTVKVFEQAGHDASGIEPGVGFHRYSREVLRARIEHRSLMDLPKEPRYDFLLLVHVIEHFNSPRRALLHLRSSLNPNGRLYVECPNLAGPHAAPGKMFHFAHIHNFTADTFEMLAESCGFRVIKSLAQPDAKVLRYLLVSSEDRKLTLRPESYARTCAALKRYNRWTYHLRWSYLQERIGRDLRFLSHHFLPERRMQRILDRCRASAPTVFCSEERPASRFLTAESHS